jgi:PAS domain S-box-containing protein
MATDLVLRVLMIDDDPDDVLLAEEVLQRFGYTIFAQRVDTAAALEAALTRQSWDLIVCDYSMPTFNGLEAVALVRRRGLDVPFILMSGTVGEEIAVAALHGGADDYIMKGNLIGLGPRVQRAVREAEERRQRRQAEERLVAERDLLQTLIDALPDAIYVEDEQLRFLRVNLAQAHFLGATTTEELLGKTDFDYFPPELARQFGEQERRILANGQPILNDLEDHSSLSHGKRWILASKVPLRQGGRVIGLVGISRDITALKQAEEELMLAYDTTIEGWSRALDLRDKETEGHSRRVTTNTVALAQVMGLSSTELVHVRRGALLHDIGKMGVPDAILLKPEPLTEDEWVMMRRHPRYAYDLLSPISFLRPALDIPYCHHEKWDGSGYPRGLVGDQIPLSARIFAAVDVGDALSSDRPYRNGWPEARVHAHIAAGAGTHFDPTVVAAFMAMDWPAQVDPSGTT